MLLVTDNPPQPVVTECGSLLNDSLHYAKHFHEVKAIMKSF